MANNGWIKLHRKLLNHWIFTDAVALKIWIYLLLDANHEDGKTMMGGELVAVKAGQTITSIRKIAAETGCSRYKVGRTLEALKKDGMITPKKVQHGTVLTVNNYKAFQRISTVSSATDCTSGCATDLANDLANDCATDLAQTRNTRNIKKDKENKKPASRIGFYDSELED